MPSVAGAASTAPPFTFRKAAMKLAYITSSKIFLLSVKWPLCRPVWQIHLVEFLLCPKYYVGGAASRRALPCAACTPQRAEGAHTCALRIYTRAQSQYWAIYALPAACIPTTSK